MKRSGTTRPRVGCRQRTSASNAGDRVGPQVVDRLVDEHQLVALDRPLQVHLEVQALDDRRVHLGLEDRVAALAARLGAVHRQVGVAKQRLGAASVPVAIPMLAADEDLAPAELERRLERLEDPLRGAAPRRWARRTSSSSTANSSPPRRATVSAGPQRSRRCRSATETQQPVARRWPEAVVERLEAVEVAEQHGDGAAGSLGARDRVAQPVQQQRSVRQAR